MKISYAITVYNEVEEIKRLISLLINNKREQDEIVVLMDTKGPDEVWNYLKSLEDLIIGTRGIFRNDFAEWKNKLNYLCTGDYIFQLDADEHLYPELIQIIPSIIEENPSVDLFWIPRINTVEGLTGEYIQKWGWTVNKEGWVNFPDYQGRLYRNRKDIEWRGTVHEKIIGHSTFSWLPEEELFCILHPKQLEKQIKQNTYYETL